MVGQNELKQTLTAHLEKGTLPPLVIITGSEGSGKKTLTREIFSSVRSKFLEDVKVETIRKMISDSYSEKGMHYVIPDAGRMSPAAKSALLKITEEPANGCKYIITLNNLQEVPPTITSRGAIFRMDPYSAGELEEYVNTHHKDKFKKLDSEDAKFVMRTCHNPGEINMMLDYDVKAFRKYVELTLDNITEVSGANSFKISEKLKVKETDKHYDLKLFWSAYSAEALYRSTERVGLERLRYLYHTRETNRCLQELGVPGINKKMLVDDWILSIRREVSSLGVD